MKNIVLIGMPGAGKSTLGVILAKVLGMNYVDTDLLVQERAGRLLQEIIDTGGTEAFLKIEEESLLALRCTGTVIATGGSVVLSERLMEHLRKDAIIVYLKISFPEMERRLSDIRTRGVVLPQGLGLRGMYDQRAPLYEKYADITVDCGNAGFEERVGTVIDELNRFLLQDGLRHQIPS
jgi:shikimate kinase